MYLLLTLKKKKNTLSANQDEDTFFVILNINSCYFHFILIFFTLFLSPLSLSDSEPSYDATQRGMDRYLDSLFDPVLSDGVW